MSSLKKNVKQVFHFWGGATALLFTYTHMSHDLATGLLPALLPFIRADLGLNYLQSGLLLSALTIAAGISQFPGGWLGDRFSRNIVAAIGLTGISIASVAIGLSSAYYVIFALLIVVGLFAGAYHPSSTSIISSNFEESRRGKAVSLHMLGGSLGFTLGPVFGGLIGGTLGWHYAFIILCIPALIAAVLFLKKLRPQQPLGATTIDMPPLEVDGALPAATPKRIGLWQALRPVALVAVLAVFSQLIAGSAQSYIPLYLVDKHGIAPASSAMLAGIIRAGGVAGSLFGGWSSDRWGRNRTLLLSLVVLGPSLYLINILPFSGWLIVAFVVFGFVMYSRQVAVQTLLMDSTPPYLRATVFGIFFGLSMEGMSLAQPIAGYYMDIFGMIPVYNVITYICLALSLMALVLIIKRRLQHSYDAL